MLRRRHQRTVRQKDRRSIADTRARHRVSSAHCLVNGLRCRATNVCADLRSSEARTSARRRSYFRPAAVARHATFHLDHSREHCLSLLSLPNPCQSFRECNFLDNVLVASNHLGCRVLSRSCLERRSNKRSAIMLSRRSIGRGCAPTTRSSDPVRGRRRRRVADVFPNIQSTLNLAAVRLRHIAGMAWSIKHIFENRAAQNLWHF